MVAKANFEPCTRFTDRGFRKQKLRKHWFPRLDATPNTNVGAVLIYSELIPASHIFCRNKSGFVDRRVPHVHKSSNLGPRRCLLFQQDNARIPNHSEIRTRIYRLLCSRNPGGYSTENQRPLGW